MHSYYNSLEFQDITRTLALINGTANDNEIVQCLELLVRFHVQNQYVRSGKEFQLKQDHFQAIRKQLTDSEIQKVDNELETALNKFEQTSNKIQEILSLLYTRGARFECGPHEWGPYVLRNAFNCLERMYNRSNSVHCRKNFDHLICIFKGLIISNPNVLKYYHGYTSNIVGSLLSIIFPQHFIYSYQLCTNINFYYYQSIVDLVLLSIRSILNDETWLERYLLDVLRMIKLNKEQVKYDRNIIIRTTQRELIKILLNEYLKTITAWNDDWSKHLFTRTLNRFIKNDHIDTILMMYQQNQLFRNYFHMTNYIEENMNIMLGSRMGKQLFNQLIDENSLNTCFTTRKCLFELLNKKQFQILKKIIKLSISVLNETDENGNDLLLYLCLKVHGCRHCFIQYLIEIGSNVQRINVFGQSFFDVIQLKQNQKLLKKLFEHEVLVIDNLTGKIKTSLHS
ncbi:unnamed protein product [Adineta steineri]|uniref:Uncharacterized protein n=1 Tax=Adineta steineri TaxID=433720 RepID=A0A815BE57_9BILA|nr:unnamed protein product [Adineta steineri]CAF1403359.1 unnamed protein product [Adineta steineri]